MEGLGNLMAKVYPGRSAEDRAMLLAQAHWARAVPPSVARNAIPVRLNHGVLTVHTATAAWANTLQFEAETLLEKLNARRPVARVTKIVFRVGKLPEMPPPPAPAPPPLVVTPASELPEDVAVELVQIQDDAVRSAVAHAIAVGLGRARPKPASTEADGTSKKPPR